MNIPKEKTAIVTTASELSKSEKEQIQAVVQTKFTRDLSISYEVEPSMLTGMRIEVGDWIYDGSGKKELNSLIKTLKT